MVKSSPSTLSAPEPITSDHDLGKFFSGETSLDDWLKNRAIRNQASGASRCFVICEAKQVIGYYCLSASAINHESSPKSMRRNMPDPLPVILLGRLAIDQNHQNKGLGRGLVRDAMLRAVSVAREAGVFAILVHAISESARKFYISCGFIESPLQPMTLMITLETIRAILAEPE